ncbi:MAG: shikimate kinase, partial [Coriobacteriales bacterium]
MSHIYLIGFMGSGKSTVGFALAARLGRPFIDLDRLVEERAGMPVSAIFDERGEEGFRNIEEALLAEVASARPAVVACG